MKKVTALLLVICQLSFVNLSAAIRVHTIGDSTMADYNPSATDKRGWGSYLGLFFNPDFVTVNNRGKSGASTRTFYEQDAFWPSVKQQMQSGDYVLIQFAHNDEKDNGADVLEHNAYLVAHDQPAITDLRGTCPGTTYKDYMRLYVRETRELGCTPILVAPICRKYFTSEGTIRRNGQHDLGDKFTRIVDGQLLTEQKIPADDHSMDYVYHMREVARELNVPFIDLTTATRELYLQYGDDYCTQHLFCQGDKTHTAELGAKLIARLAAGLLKDANILADHITVHEVSAISSQQSTISDQPSAAGAPQEKYQLSFINYQLSTHNLCVDNDRYHNSDNGTSPTPWPADEIDENAVRYIDLAITAPADSALRITTIAMDLSAIGGTTMSVHINTGLGDAFTDVHTYYERVGLPEGFPESVVTPVLITPTHLLVPAGKTLHIRVLPWLNAETQPRNGQYIRLTGIRIEGYTAAPR